MFEDGVLDLVIVLFFSRELMYFVLNESINSRRDRLSIQLKA
jgi:hypothetical protein